MIPQPKSTAYTLISGLITEAVKYSGTYGLPSSYLYVACNKYGVSPETYEWLMQRLVSDGVLRKRGHIYMHSDAVQGAA